jgi:hypothetical protein
MFKRTLSQNLMKSDCLLPEHFRVYFWDIPFTGREFLDWPEYSIERVLEYGQWKDVRLLREIAGDQAIANIGKTSRNLSPRTVNMWAILLNISKRDTTCCQKPFPRIPPALYRPSYKRIPLKSNGKKALPKPFM